MILTALLSTTNTKVDYQYYLKELVPRLNKKLNSFSVTVNGHLHKCDGEVVNFVMDISEKEKSLLQTSGYYSCDQCYCIGEENGKKVYYPDLGEPRTPNSCIIDQIVAEKFVKNIKKRAKLFLPRALIRRRFIGKQFGPPKAD
jgi:hypothetical protein